MIKHELNSMLIHCISIYVCRYAAPNTCI